MPEGEPKFEGEKQEVNRTSGVMRVVGSAPEKGLEHFQEIIEKPEKHSFKPEWEREKTSEELEMIVRVLGKLPEFIKGFGGKPAPIKPENIHYLDADKIKGAGYTKGNFERFDPMHQEVTFCPQGGIKTLEFLVHELMHFNSFMSVTQSPGSPDKMYERRIGFGVAGNKMAFGALNEGMTQELAIRFLREYTGNPIIGKTVGSRARASLRYVGGVENRLGEVFTLRNLLSDIYKKNPEKYESEEDVFKLFADGYFNGNLLQIARLVEKTYGKGSFKRLAKEGEPIKYFHHQ